MNVMYYYGLCGTTKYMPSKLVYIVGVDSNQLRYIFVKVSSICRRLFDPADGKSTRLFLRGLCECWT